jgi:hypothetical protein
MKALMSSALALLRQLAGLFFDDGSLAIAVLVILAATAILAGTDEPAATVFLVAGIVAALLENVLRTARLARPPD